MRALLALIAVTAVWGLTFVQVKDAVALYPLFAFLAVRFAIASLALAPPTPVVTNPRGQMMIGRQPSGYDANLRWNASPGAAAYRVYWREAWTTDWQHSQAVGEVTEFMLPKLSIDNYVFGVAALGPGGHESLVSAYVPPPRRDPVVKLR